MNPGSLVPASKHLVTSLYHFSEKNSVASWVGAWASGKHVATAISRAYEGFQEAAPINAF